MASTGFLSKSGNFAFFIVPDKLIQVENHQFLYSPPKSPQPPQNFPMKQQQQQLLWCNQSQLSHNLPAVNECHLGCRRVLCGDGSWGIVESFDTVAFVPYQESQWHRCLQEDIHSHRACWSGSRTNSMGPLHLGLQHVHSTKPTLPHEEWHHSQEAYKPPASQIL